MIDYLASDAAIDTATPWSNACEARSRLRLRELNALPDASERVAAACATMPPLHPELPSAVGHAMLLRGTEQRKTGGLGASSYGS
ncbi:hypothetical protein FHY12_001413 [Xanthomonas arboricola]|nr:hypothetical protein [Xanthomonas euroxanthea]